MHARRHHHPSNVCADAAKECCRHDQKVVVLPKDREREQMSTPFLMAGQSKIHVMQEGRCTDARAAAASFQLPPSSLLLSALPAILRALSLSRVCERAELSSLLRRHTSRRRRCLPACLLAVSVPCGRRPSSLWRPFCRHPPPDALPACRYYHSSSLHAHAL